MEIQYADTNVVRLPDAMGFVEAASLGCRFATAYRAVVQQARLKPNQWLAIYGCGGLGLSALMIAKGIGAKAVAIDIAPATIEMAERAGADVTINALACPDVPQQIIQVTDGGADASIDALGTTETAANSLASLRKQGRHIQAGLLLGEHAFPALPMGLVISNELEILGSHGMSALDYPQMLEFVLSNGLDLSHLIGRRIPLSESPSALADMNEFNFAGVTVIDDFSR